ncbi:hypothetical protein DK66_3099 [Brucella suis 1330]|nr:hypothetical protein DK66_3099 [Brucella suis 1330]
MGIGLVVRWRNKAFKFSVYAGPISQGFTSCLTQQALELTLRNERLCRFGDPSAVMPCPEFCLEYIP